MERAQRTCISHSARAAISVRQHSESSSQSTADRRPGVHLQKSIEIVMALSNTTGARAVHLHGMVFIVARLVMQMTHSSSWVDDASNSLSSNLLSSFSCNFEKNELSVSQLN